MLKVIIFIIIGMFLRSSLSAQEIELLCSKALLSEMHNQKLLTNANGVCLRSLDDLPQVTIGLGSSVYESGVSLGNSLGNEDKKIKDISEILTGKTLGATSFEVFGYADGENNTIPSYTEQFLGSKKTFTKADVKKQIKDANTRDKILSLMSDVEDKSEIVPVWGNGSGSSLKHEQGINYIKNIDRIMSLINNYFLATDRATQTCLQLAREEFDNGEAAKKFCEARISGFASPHSETLSDGNIHCDGRRKAVLVLNPSLKATKSTNPGLVLPNFRLTSEKEGRRDMQVASTLDLFKKISQSNIDPQTVIEKMALDCSGNPLNPVAYDFNRQNLLRMYDDITGLATQVNDAHFKDAILKGDYGRVKKYLIDAQEALADGQAIPSDPIQKMIQGLSYGVDSEAQKDRIRMEWAPPKAGKELRCKKVESPQELKEFHHASQGAPVFECFEYDLINNRKKLQPMYLFVELNNRSKVVLIESGWSVGKRWKRSNTDSLIVFQDSKYPKASRDINSTDVFNCLSAASAIEEKLVNQNQTGAGGEVTDPYDLYPDSSGNVKVIINSKSLPTYPNSNGATADKGWMCEKCHSGIHVVTNKEKVSTVSRKSRETIQNEAGTQSQSNAPIKDMGLTFGSMKNLNIRKVTRESFGGKCPDNKKVCECLKNVSSYGGLDSVLMKSEMVNLNKSLSANLSMTDYDLKNSCLYTPPVAHSCSVAPSGERTDDIKRGLKSPSCLALQRFMDKYPQRKSVVDSKYPKLEDYLNTYHKAKLAPLLCKNAFPSEDDSKDCKWGSSGPGNGAKASKARKQ